MTFGNEDPGPAGDAARAKSQLRQWPIQLHLVSPAAPCFQGADVLLAADCAPFAMGNFHEDFLKGKAVGVACPKLDGDQDVYVAKIKALFEEARIASLTVLIMQVPCCRGLLGLAMEALKASSRKAPVRCAVVSLQGNVIKDEPVEA